MDTFQRNSMMLSTPKVAPISLGQYGLPRPDLSSMNTAGGVGIPNLGQGAALPDQNFLSQQEIWAMGAQDRQRNQDTLSQPGLASMPVSPTFRGGGSAGWSSDWYRERYLNTADEDMRNGLLGTGLTSTDLPPWMR